MKTKYAKLLVFTPDLSESVDEKAHPDDREMDLADKVAGSFESVISFLAKRIRRAYPNMGDLEIGSVLTRAFEFALLHNEDGEFGGS